MLDAALGTLIVVEDANRTILDANVVPKDDRPNQDLFLRREAICESAGRSIV